MYRSDEHSQEHHTQSRLALQDCEALDALVQAGFDLRLLPDAMKQRASKLADLLDVACSCPGVSHCDQRTAKVLAAVASLSQSSAQSSEVANSTRQAPSPPDVLSWEDEEAVDAYVMAGYRVERVSSSLRGRAVKAAALGQLLTATIDVTPSALLIERTLARVQATSIARPSASDASIAGRIGGLRLADVFSMAAVAVLGVSVMWPVLASLRNQSMRAVCGSNMQTMANAMGVYAGDYRGAMPVATASLAGATWWDVGSGPARSNSANLFQLPKLHYASLAQMACPGNPTASKGCESLGRDDWGCPKEVSYSYQVMFGAQRPGWGERNSYGEGGGAASSGAMVVLADKSPVVARALAKQRLNPEENSPNHGGDGQWVVRADGSAAWLQSPLVKEDNIWLPCSADRAVAVAKSRMKATGASAAIVELTLLGNEVTVQRGNTFVGP